MSYDADFQLIPHTDADADQKRGWEEIMAEGNVVLAELHEAVKRKITGKYSKAKLRIALFKAIKETSKGTVYVHKVPVSKDKLAKIQAVRDIEWPLMCSLGKLMFEQADKWTKLPHNTGLSFGDFYNEASMAVSDAIYGYTNLDVKFITYAVWAIKHRILKSVNENRPLCPLSQNSIKLITLVNRTTKALSTKFGRPATFEEVAKKLKLNEKEISTVKDMKAKVIKHSELFVNDQDEDFSDDSGIYGVTEPESSSDLDVAVLTDIEMSDWERAVLQAYLAAPAGSRGWQTEVAKNHINPETGEPYSRRAPRIALNRILERIKLAHGKSIAA
ncbi:MAG: hypothetical protein DWQ19_09285 [Crenarchaeota archaeon]|nr:MAG: hypothetical protein DWQ19_09285 [Thermoproteota archaeon]